MRTCKLNDVEIAYTDRGAGPTLVLVHGFPLDCRVWDDAAVILQQQFRVVTPDLRGFGKSISETCFTINSLADDLNQFLTAIDAAPCILGGLSMGGYVVQAFAQKYPSELSALILIDTKSEADTPAGRQGRQQMIELVRKSGSKAIADQMFPKMVAPGSEKSTAAIKLRSIMEGCPPKTIEYALGAMRDREDYTALLPNLVVPILIVVGAEDAIAPPDVARAMHQSAAGSKLSIIPRAGHMAPIEQPQAFADRLIAEFLKNN